MEVVLQWLDELDDLVFAGFSIWGRLRRFFLAIALVAALAVPAIPGSSVAGEAVLWLLLVSLAALAGWGVVAAVSAAAERESRTIAQT